MTADVYTWGMNTTTKKSRASLFPEGPRPSSITDALRAAMMERSAYSLAHASGVNVAAVLRFKSGERSLNLQSVDALAEVLGLELVPRRAAPKK